MSLQELKAEEVKILDAFVAFCEKNNITYYLIYGTLLGAVRHQGFIPWDDDIDVTVPRDDYEKLLILLKDQTLYAADGEPLKAMYYSYGNVAYFFLKLVSTRTKVEEKRYDMKMEYGVWIDIFPLDAFPEKGFRHKYDLFLRRMYMQLWAESCILPGEGSNSFLRVLRQFLYPLTHSINTYRLAGRIDQYAKNCKAGKTDTVAINCVGAKLTVLHRAWFDKTISLMFEGKEYTVPKEYDKILTAFYGDYMQLPPESERKTHLLKAYWLD